MQIHLKFMVCRTFKLTLFEIVGSPLGFNGVAQNLSLKLCGFLGNSKLERHWVPAGILPKLVKYLESIFIKSNFVFYSKILIIAFLLFRMRFKGLCTTSAHLISEFLLSSLEKNTCVSVGASIAPCDKTV